MSKPIPTRLRTLALAACLLAAFQHVRACAGDEQERAHGNQCLAAADQGVNADHGGERDVERHCAGEGQFDCGGGCADLDGEPGGNGPTDDQA